MLGALATCLPMLWSGTGLCAGDNAQTLIEGVEEALTSPGLPVPASITAGPRLLPRGPSSSVRNYTNTYPTVVSGKLSTLIGASSLCGWVTQDIRSYSHSTRIFRC
jgi:hypothetical protein